MLIATLVLVVLVLVVAGSVWARRRRRPLVETPAPRVAAAVMTIAAHRSVPLAHELQAAMAQAVTDALERGVSIHDTAAIRAAMQEARERVLGRSAPEGQ